MLPNIATAEAFDAFGNKEPVFLEATKEILSKLNLNGSVLSFPDSGSLPVVIVDDQFVVKYFPQVFKEAFLNELKALEYLGSNGLACPKVMSAGELSSWNYIFMNKLPGQSLKQLWPVTSEENKREACRQVGRELRKFHSLQLPAGLNAEEEWKSFLATQIEGCYARQKKLGLSEKYLEQIPQFLNKVKLEWSRISFLHTEVMKDHVIFEKNPGGLHLSGFIDFEPSMFGSPEYDFASVGVFLSSGDSGSLRSFFEGYGNLELASDSGFRRRVLAYTLLHRYSRLKWYLEFLPTADTLEELADIWWEV